jgi:orotate phosphoribosyltransferase
MNYRSIARLADDMRAWSTALPRDIDLVVGVPRSGLLVANLIALYRNLPLADLQGLLQGNLLTSGPRCSSPLDPEGLSNRSLTILVVDECVSTGSAMREVMEQVMRGEATAAQIGGFLVALLVVAMLLDAALDGSIMLARREREEDE